MSAETWKLPEDAPLPIKVKDLIPGWVVRDMTTDDLNAVTGMFLDSWARAYASGNFPWEDIPGMPSFRDVYGPVPTHWLKHGFGKIACLEGEPDFIGGWMLGRKFDGYGNGLEQPILYYVYVKKLYRTEYRDGQLRKIGLAKALIEEAGIDPQKPFRYASTTKDWEKVVCGKNKAKKPTWSGARLDPNIARYQSPPEKWRTHE